MINTFFQGIFDSSTTSVIPVSQFLLCIGVSLVLGIILACAYSYKTRHNGSFVRTLAILPAVVCVVIMMVNGNVGAGVAVAGAFSLVRFRSVPGSAKDIGAIFIAMGTGLVTGMGYLGYAAVFAVVLSLIMVAYVHMNLWDRRQISEKQLIITIPEDLDYTQVFDDLMEQYTEKNNLVKVKTTNMGSLFKLTYEVKLKDPAKEKEFIDELRCRNGNLEIMMTNQEIGNQLL